MSSFVNQTILNRKIRSTPAKVVATSLVSQTPIVAQHVSIPTISTHVPTSEIKSVPIHPTTSSKVSQIPTVAQHVSIPTISTHVPTSEIKSVPIHPTTSSKVSQIPTHIGTSEIKSIPIALQIPKIKNIAFFVNHFSIRGTEVAIYDYAYWNQVILKNKSIIILASDYKTRRNVKGELLHSQEIEDKFRREFQILLLPEKSKKGLEKLLSNEANGGKKIDVLYILKSGENDGVFSSVIPTIVHTVFSWDEKQSHGNIYLPISENVNTNYSGLVLPHICYKSENITSVIRSNLTTELIDTIGKNRNSFDINKVDDIYIGEWESKSIKNEKGMRKKLNIPMDAFVIGRYGGSESFDIPFVHEWIKTFDFSTVGSQSRPYSSVSVSKPIYFLFMGTNKFMEKASKNIIFLPAISNEMEKKKFIQTCDVMLHCRSIGESFGLSVAEFSNLNKPVLSYVPISIYNILDQERSNILNDNSPKVPLSASSSLFENSLLNKKFLDSFSEGFSRLIFIGKDKNYQTHHIKVLGRYGFYFHDLSTLTEQLKKIMVNLSIIQSSTIYQTLYSNYSPEKVIKTFELIANSILEKKIIRHEYQSIDTKSSWFVSTYVPHYGVTYSVVNLDRRRDRFYDLVSEFKKNNITEFKRKSAIDGRLIDITGDNASFAGKSKKYLNYMRNYLLSYGKKENILGCYLSHFDLWMECLKGKEKYMVILEDDIRLVSNFRAELDHVLIMMEAEDTKNKANTLQSTNDKDSTSLNEDIDLVYIGYHINSTVEKEIGIDQNKIMEIFTNGKQGIFPLSESTRKFGTMRDVFGVSGGGTHGYIISRKGAEKLIRNFNTWGCVWPLDYQMLFSDKVILENHPFLKGYSSTIELFSSSPLLNSYLCSERLVHVRENNDSDIQ